jgi:heme/copper-type cytochrome/quinol oxidase subunit 2
MRIKQIQMLDSKKAQISQLPGFFQVMMMVIIFAGLTFIVLDKFLGTTTSGTMAYKAINESTEDLYDYGIGFLGIIILVVMVYLIISIVSGRQEKGAR